MKEYLDLIDEDNRNQSLSFYDFLEANCSDSKGSSHNHQSWSGGYFDHILEVFKYAQKLHIILSEDRELDFSLSDALLVLFLHDIEKPIKYSNSNMCQYLLTFNKSDEELKNYLIDKYGFKLNYNHLKALKYIHGEGSDYQKNNRVMNPLGAFCHCCDVISARIFFDYPKK